MFYGHGMTAVIIALYRSGVKVFLTELFEAMFDELPSPKRKNNGIGGITDELYSDHKRKY